MGWKVGESWLDSEVLWFRETAAVALPAPPSFPPLALPPSFEARRIDPLPARRSSRRLPALAVVLGSAVVLPVASHSGSATLGRISTLWDDPPSQTLRLRPGGDLDLRDDEGARVSASTGLGVATATKAFERHGDPAELVHWHHAVSRGLPFGGSLVNGTQLPAIGPDWVTWNPVTDSSPNLPRRLYGNERTIRALVEVISAYRAAHPNAPPVVVGDISREGGGRMDEHVSHQNGLDVDVYYPRLDRIPKAPTSTTQIDRRLAQDLLSRFVAAGARMVFVGYSTGLKGPSGVVIPYPNHENHMHVRFPQP